MKLLTFHPGGIRLPESKLSARSPIIYLDLPEKVTITLSQHKGAPAKAVVKPGDEVTRFQLIAEASARFSANIHTPLSGTVKSVGKTRGAFGYDVETITIEASEEQRRRDLEASPRRIRDDAAIAALTSAQICGIAREYGLVGMGGATFPTDIKLDLPPDKKVDVLIVNGAECEPYLTSDHALMLAEPEAILNGVELARRACGAKRAIIGIEANKKDAIETLKKRISPGNTVEIHSLRERYPQGGEKQLINALTGRHVRSGELPVDAGAVVINVATAHALWRAAAFGEPLVARIVTVTGPSVKTPANYHACIGYDITSLLEKSGAEIEQGAKLVLGGPMMGRAVIGADISVEKGTSGILLLPPEQAARRTPDPCVRCARCVDVCPMGLEPYLLATLSRFGKTEEAERQSMNDCIECGCCSYICPSARPILDFIRLGKNLRRKSRNKSKQ